VNSSSVDLYTAVVDEWPKNQIIELSASGSIDLWERFRDKALPTLLSLSKLEHSPVNAAIDASAQLDTLPVVPSNETGTVSIQETFEEFHRSLASITPRVRVVTREDSSQTINIVQGVYIETFIKKNKVFLHCLLESNQHKPIEYLESCVLWALLSELINTSITLVTQSSDFNDGMHLIVPSGILHINLLTYYKNIYITLCTEFHSCSNDIK